ncbi:hypothetical protein [Inhella sp.]
MRVVDPLPATSLCTLVMSVPFAVYLLDLGKVVERAAVILGLSDRVKGR